MEAKKFATCFYLQNNVEVLDFAGPMEAFVYAGFEIFTSKIGLPKATRSFE